MLINMLFPKKKSAISKGLMLMPHENGFGVTVLPHYTYKQAQTYISNMSEVDKSLYSKVLNIANERSTDS